MFSKQFFVLCSVVAFAAGAVVPVAPAAPVLAKLEDFDAAPQYSFAYDVQDAITGDSKAQYENRQGDVVQGSYSLIEADGTRRIVDYTADPVNGFNAVVSREPAVAVAAPVVAKAAVAAPIVSKPVIAPAVAPARIVAPAVAPAQVVAPAAIPAAPLVARNYVGPAAALAAVPAAPLAYTLPRAVASRLTAPFFYL